MHCLLVLLCVSHSNAVAFTAVKAHTLKRSEQASGWDREKEYVAPKQRVCPLYAFVLFRVRSFFRLYSSFFSLFATASIDNVVILCFFFFFISFAVFCRLARPSCVGLSSTKARVKVDSISLTLVVCLFSLLLFIPYFFSVFFSFL